MKTATPISELPDFDVPGHATNDSLDEMLKMEQRQSIGIAMKALNDRELKAFYAVYKLDSECPETCRSLAKRFRVSPQTISNDARRARAKLQESLAGWQP